jgi:hypothetical protein
MKRLVCCSVLSLFALVAPAALAQPTYIVGVGAAKATGDFADIDSVKSGTAIMAGIERPGFLTNGVSLRIDGLLSDLSRETDFNESQYVAALYARLAYFLPLNMTNVRPYLLGGLGYMYTKYNPGSKIRQAFSESGVVLSGGVGSEVNVGPVSTFLEGRFETGSEVKSLMTVFIGVRLKTGS